MNFTHKREKAFGAWKMLIPRQNTGSGLGNVLGVQLGTECVYHWHLKFPFVYKLIISDADLQNIVVILWHMLPQ